MQRSVRHILPIMLVLSLGGTGLAYAQGNSNYAATKYASDRAACRQDETLKTILASERCMIVAEKNYLTAINFPWMDLFYTNASERLTIAKNIDDHKISVEAGSYALSASDARMTEAVNQRTAAVTRSQQAQQGQDSQGQAQALDFASKLLSPTPASPSTVYVAPQQTTCFRNGPNLVCHSQ